MANASKAVFPWEFGGVPQHAPETEKATPPTELFENTTRGTPNIALNYYHTMWRSTLLSLVRLIIGLQLAVFVYSGFNTYWLVLGKKGQRVFYGCLLMDAGMALLVIGVLVCSHAVEQHIAEQAWDIEATPMNQKVTLGPQILRLQRGGYIKNQRFPSLGIFGQGTGNSILTSWQGEVCKEDSTLLMRLYSCLLQLVNLNLERPGTSARSRRLLECMVLIGALTGTFGFVTRFTGLQSMNWLALIAQLAMTVVAIFIGALVHLGTTNTAPTHQIPAGHELDWLATRLGGNPKPLWTSLGNPKQNSHQQQVLAGIQDCQCWNWSVVTGVERDKFASLDESQFDGGLNDVFRIRKRLGKLSNWTGPASKSAISVARSVEAVMNTIFSQKEYPQLKTLEWFVYGHRGSSKLGKINLSAKRGEDKRWTACAEEIEAVLSLWLYCMKEGGKDSFPDLALSGNGARDDWLRNRQATAQRRTIRLLARNEEDICQDLHWYLGEGVGFISQVKTEESEVTDPAPPTNNTTKIETCNIIGSTEIAQNHQHFTRFRTQGIQLHSNCRQTTPNSVNQIGETAWYDYLAVVADSSLELLLAQDLFSSFMWFVADRMRRLSVESTTSRLRPTDLTWFDSSRLENPVLSSMAREIERAGLGTLGDAYASILPPLSIKKKLPIPRCVVTHAHKTAQFHLANGEGDWATYAYQMLLGRCIAFGQASPLAVQTTAIVYEGLRACRALTYLWERWEPAPLERFARRKYERNLQQLLRIADERVVLNLRTMHKIQRRQVAGGEDSCTNDCHQKITCSGPGQPLWGVDDLIGFSPYDKACLCLTPLHCAVIADDWVEVECYLAGGANPDLKDVLGWTPLHYAATRGSPGITGILLSTTELAGANPNIEDLAGRTALHQAAENGHEEVVQLLLENGARIGKKDAHGSTPLHLAAQNGHLDTSLALLASGADGRKGDQFWCQPLHLAANNGHLDVVHFLLQEDAENEPKDKIKQTPLHHAANNGQPEVIQFLLQNGAAKEAGTDRGDKPLHHAAYGGHLEAVRVLLENGADKEAGSLYSEKPLHYAAQYGHFDVVRLLLDQSAMVEARNFTSQTSLHLSAGGGHLDIVQLLLERDANTEAEDRWKLRPLHYAASGGRLGIVRLLIEKAGADKEARDDEGRRPLHYAAERGHLDVVRLLLNNGADMEAEDNHGRSAYLTAIHRRQPAVAQLFRESAEREKQSTKKG